MRGCRHEGEPSRLRRALTQVEEPRGSVATVALLSGSGMLLLAALEQAMPAAMMGAAIVVGGVWNGMAVRLGRRRRHTH